MENIKIIGTSHIATQSIAEIKKYINEEKPDLVALELDWNRAAVLLEEKKTKISLLDAWQIGLKGYLLAKIGQYAQQKMGKIVGVSPGAEMKTALELARKHHLEIAFIDQPLSITLHNFSKELTWKEKGRFLADLLKGLFFPRRQVRELGLEDFDLRRVPKERVIEKMVNQLKKRYPSVYKTLVEDRNKYMVKRLVGLRQKSPEKKILVVVGAGHEKGMNELLQKINIIKR